jgi:hypothetical protein
VIDPGPWMDWPIGTVPIPDGVVRHRLRDTDVMDPYLSEELFNPITGAWIGRGPRPGPAPELWAEIWGIDWPSGARSTSESTRVAEGVPTANPTMWNLGCMAAGALAGELLAATFELGRNTGGIIGAVTGALWGAARYSKYGRP